MVFSVFFMKGIPTIQTRERRTIFRGDSGLARLVVPADKPIRSVPSRKSQETPRSFRPGSIERPSYLGRFFKGLLVVAGLGVGGYVFAPYLGKAIDHYLDESMAIMEKNNVSPIQDNGSHSIYSLNFGDEDSESH